jgi:putative intracellular protease/amidase
MKRLISLLLVSLLFASAGYGSQKVLLLIKEGSPQQDYMLINEVGKMIDILKNEGFEVTIATVSGEILKSGKLTIKPDHKLAEINIKDYEGLILPCMTIDSADPDFISAAKTASEQGKPVAAQAGSVMILARAGLLKGKKYALNIDMSSDPDFGAGQYDGKGVVMDGNILTSGICPWLAKETGSPDGTETLTRMLADALKVKTK